MFLRSLLDKVFIYQIDRATIRLADIAFEENVSGGVAYKEGQKVQIHMGYDEPRHLEFTGYIARIERRRFTELHCEDSMYLTRRKIAPFIFLNSKVNTETGEELKSLTNPDTKTDIPVTQFPDGLNMLDVFRKITYELNKEIERVNENAKAKDLHKLFRLIVRDEEVPVGA